MNMKTLYIIAFTFLLQVFVSHAMDTMALSNMCSDICGFKRLRIEQENGVDFKKLPIDLCHKLAGDYISIVVHEDIDQEKLKKYISDTHIYLTIRVAKNFEELEKACRHTIGDKKFLRNDLFALPFQYQDVFIRMANRSSLKNLIEGNIAVNDYNILITMKDESIKKGLELRILRTSKTISYMNFIGVMGVGIGVILVWCFPVCVTMTNTPSFAKVYVSSLLTGVFGGLATSGLARIFIKPEQRDNNGMEQISL